VEEKYEKNKQTNHKENGKRRHGKYRKERKGYNTVIKMYRNKGEI